MPDLCSLILFVAVIGPWGANGAGAPLEGMAKDVAEIKITLSSVQGSLITSVRMIQDQMDQFAKTLGHLKEGMDSEAVSFSGKVEKIDKRLVDIELGLQEIQSKSRVWDTFQHHVQSWSSLMTSLDSKIDHLARSQTDQFGNTANQISSLQSNFLTVGNQLNEKLGRLENFAQQTPDDPIKEQFTSRGVLVTIQEMDEKLNNLLKRTGHTTTNNRTSIHSNDDSGRHHHIKVLTDLTREIDAKLDFVHESCQQQSSKQYDSLDQDYAEEYQSGDSSVQMKGTTNNVVRMVRRFSVPCRRSNKFLRELDRKNQDKFGQILEALESASVDSERKFYDYFNMTADMFDHQHKLLERYQSKLASLDLCCQGTNGDLSALRARYSPVWDKMESYINTKNYGNNQDRLREQLRFDMNRIFSKLDFQKGLILDSCRSNFKSKVLNNSQTISNSNANNSVTVAEDSEKEQLRVDVDFHSPVEESEEVGEVFKDDSFKRTSSHAEERSLLIEVSEKNLKNCEDLIQAGFFDSKVYNVDENDDDALRNEDDEKRTFSGKSYCEQNVSGGGWTVILNRGDYGEPRENFTREWDDYKNGFGNLNDEFWLGNDAIYQLTNEKPVELRVELTDFEGAFVFGEYSTFRIGSEDENYRLTIGGYSGNATDSLAAHNGSSFSTVDRDNDEAPPCCPCAPAYGGGWWFYSCFESNLNGQYHDNPTENDYYRGIIWELWKGDYSLKSARMMIRSKDFLLNNDLNKRKIIQQENDDVDSVPDP